MKPFGRARFCLSSPLRVMIQSAKTCEKRKFLNNWVKSKQVSQ